MCVSNYPFAAFGVGLVLPHRLYAVFEQMQICVGRQVVQAHQVTVHGPPLFDGAYLRNEPQRLAVALRLCLYAPYVSSGPLGEPQPVRVLQSVLVRGVFNGPQVDVVRLLIAAVRVFAVVFQSVGKTCWETITKLSVGLTLRICWTWRCLSYLYYTPYNYILSQTISRIFRFLENARFIRIVYYFTSSCIHIPFFLTINTNFKKTKRLETF